jgi:RNA polymerase sigma factor (sigma-70 family)
LAASTESESDIADDITDQIIARKALAFVESLDDQAHVIAMMAWVDGLKPKEIAERLRLKAPTIRKSLHLTRKKIRTQLGVAEPQRILREERT